MPHRNRVLLGFWKWVALCVSEIVYRRFSSNFRTIAEKPSAPATVADNEGDGDRGN